MLVFKPLRERHELCVAPGQVLDALLVRYEVAEDPTGPRDLDGVDRPDAGPVRLFRASVLCEKLVFVRGMRDALAREGH